jgi:hypothetical protein
METINPTTAPNASPNWAVKVGRFLSDLFGPMGEQEVTRPRASDSLTRSPDSTEARIENAWAVQQDRKSVYENEVRMAKEDPLIAQALDIVADYTVTQGDEDHPAVVVLTENAEVETVLAALFDRLSMDDLAWQIARKAYHHGTYLPEVVLDAKRERIIKVKETLNYQIWPNTNKAGDKVPGWIYKKDSELAIGGKGQALEEWQILPVFFGERNGFFAEGPLASMRKKWNRLAMLEDGMAIARLTRAYDKLVHRVPVDKSMTPDEINASIQRYKAAMNRKKFTASTGDGTTQTLSATGNPFTVSTDLFLPDTGDQKGGVEMLSSNTNSLANLNDIQYQREPLLSRLGPPVTYLQIYSAQKTHLKSTGTMSDAEKVFFQIVRRLQATLRRALRRLCDMELQLHGITPTKEMYKLVFPRVPDRDLKLEADIELTFAQAAVYFVEAFGFLPAEFLAEKFLRLDDKSRKIFEQFLKAEANTVDKARVKQIETDAEPKPAATGTGSGNQNKSKAKRSTEQRPKPRSQSGDDFPEGVVLLEDAVEAFRELESLIYADLRAQGIAVPQIEGSLHEEAIRAQLTAIALNE